MDDTSQVVIERNRPPCPVCGDPLKKRGFAQGKQIWQCHTCNVQGIHMLDRKPKLESDSPGGHSFFDGYTVVGYEPPEYCNKRTSCSACKHLLRCGDETGQLPCEGVYLIQTRDEVMRL
jgi:hypothetical protein